MTSVTRPATPDELAHVWPAVSAAHLFDDAAALRTFFDEAPWRVRITGDGEAALLGRWRESLDILAIRGLWCSERRIPVILEDLRGVAREQGFGRLLGPLVPEEAVGPYEAAGLSVAYRIVICRLGSIKARAVLPPQGVTVREGTAADSGGVLVVDSASFDEFWRYDPATLQEYVRRERLAVAVRNGSVIGYTLSVVQAGEATIARLAVRPSERGRGIGRALLREAIAYAATSGARAITLSTQEDNATSRRLYRSEGFRESPGRLVGAISREL